MKTKSKKEVAGQGKFALRWYRWGDEKVGYVSTWRLVGNDGKWEHYGQRKRASLPKNAIADCPFS